MKNLRILILGILLIVLSSFCYADYFYTPFNFDSQMNHDFDVSLNGSIEVILPDDFTLVSGSLTGTNTVSFVMQSPSVTGDDAEVYTGTINLNGSFYETFHLIYTPDSKIVDTKIEIDHGDFNYIDPDSYIGTDRTLLFNLVRVWAIGSDIIGEPARDITFNCSFPKIVPNSVDSKYDTEYLTDSIRAEGELLRAEGISLFRIFVLSQEVEQVAGTNYEVDCDELRYSFPHTEVIADIPDINLSVRNTEPLQIAMFNNSEYVTYSFLNNELYDLRNLEFLFEVGTDTIRKELDSLDAGESYTFNIPTNESGSIDVKARFVPEWMFNSRSPIYYEQESFDIYYTPSFLDGLITTEYYDNQVINNPSILTGQKMSFSIDLLQEPPFSDEFVVTHRFYDENGVFVFSNIDILSGLGTKTIEYYSNSIPVNGKNNEFEVKSIVSIYDEDGNLYDFDTESIGIQKISALASKNIVTETPVLSAPEEKEPETNEITGMSIIESKIESSGINPFIYIVVFVGLLLFLIVFLASRRKRKEENRYPTAQTSYNK